MILFTPTLLISQETENKEDSIKIEKVPIYPGCKGDTNEALRNCMSAKVQESINKNYRTNVIDGKDLKNGIYKIIISFKFTKKGRAEIIKVTAPNEATKQEAIRVIKKLKRVKPGTVDGKPVGVIYSIPITLRKE
jgi:protein TonB